MTKFYDVNADEVDEDGEQKDLGVYEARRLIGPNSYSDDDWTLVRYTSELRYNDNDKFFAFIDFHGDEGTIRECPHCLQYQIHNNLGPKIKQKGEPVAPDDDQWLSCYEWGRTFPIHETHYESKIKHSVETTDNPFDNESTFLSTDSRATQRKKGKKRKGRFSHFQEHEDPEIPREIDRHGSDNVRIHT